MLMNSGGGEEGGILDLNKTTELLVCKKNIYWGGGGEGRHGTPRKKKRLKACNYMSDLQFCSLSFGTL